MFVSFFYVTSNLKLKTHSQLTQSLFTDTDCLFLLLGFSSYFIQWYLALHKISPKLNYVYYLDYIGWYSLTQHNQCNQPH